MKRNGFLSSVWKSRIPLVIMLVLGVALGAGAASTEDDFYKEIPLFTDVLRKLAYVISVRLTNQSK